MSSHMNDDDMTENTDTVQGRVGLLKHQDKREVI